MGADVIKYIGITDAPVAQLDRAIASDAMCRAFESHQAYHINSNRPLGGFFIAKISGINILRSRFSQTAQNLFRTIH